MIVLYQKYRQSQGIREMLISLHQGPSLASILKLVVLKTIRGCIDIFSPVFSMYYALPLELKC